MKDIKFLNGSSVSTIESSGNTRSNRASIVTYIPKGKDEDYELAVSEIRDSIGYSPLSTLTSIIHRLCEEYCLDWDEVKEDIGVGEW